VKKTATLLLAIGLASCAAPKAIIIEEAPNVAAETDTSTPRPVRPNLPPNDGMRLPEDLLSLPEDSQLRSAAADQKDGDATIITRPPQE
jgi:hypothetical protein